MTNKDASSVMRPTPFKMIQLSGKTSLLGLLGWPVSHSKSPAMQTAAAQAAGLDYLYVPLPVHPDAVGDAVRGLPSLGFKGVNVTVPHKQAVIPFLDELDPAAEALGAVNTIVVSQSEAEYAPRLKGFNTDGIGFLTDLQSYGVGVEDRSCFVIGGGGSARAVAYTLAMNGAKVHLFTRRPEQMQAVVKQLTPHVPDLSLIGQSLSALPDFASTHPDAIIVNTTPVGMSPNVDRSVWQDEWSFPTQGFVYDLVYNPSETRLMTQARAAGLAAANGLGMLLYQGAEAFYLWTGVRPNVAVMREALGG